MKKSQTSIRIIDDNLSFIDKVAEINQISRSQAVDLLSEMVQDYFSDEQIKAELKVRGVYDGRRSKKVQG